MMDVQPDFKSITLKQLKNPVQHLNAARPKSRFCGGFFGSLLRCILLILLFFSASTGQIALSQARVRDTVVRDSLNTSSSTERTLLPDSLQAGPDSLAPMEEKADQGLEGINAVVEYQPKIP
jgi:predicted lipid-binding transport protein (Tim44 family)